MRDPEFSRIIQSPDFYAWDNWGFMTSEEKIHIYAQYCPRSTCRVPEDRYWQAQIRHFYSEDRGEHWYDEGTVLSANQDPSAFDSSAIWSGSTLPISDKRVLMAYTGLKSPGPDQHIPGRQYAFQSIGLAVSDDGGWTFTRPSAPLIDAEKQYDQLRQLGYYFGPKNTLGMIDEADGTFMTMRDPFLFLDDGCLHLFFGAKTTVRIDGSEKIRNAVGHVKIWDLNRPDEYVLCRPILFSDETDFNQCELPNVFRIGSWYYLVISATMLHDIGEPDDLVDKTVRMYRSKTIETGWEPFGPQGRHILLENRRDRLYGLNIIKSSYQTNRLAARAFVVGESYLPETIYLNIHEESASYDL